MSRLIAEYAGPPADRMAGRQQARAARAQAKGYTPKQTISAATEAKANAFLGREALLDQAIHAGVIDSGNRAHYATCYDADPTGTRSYMASLGLRQSAPAPAASEEYPTAGLSRSELNRIQAAREGRTSRIINGGL